MGRGASRHPDSFRDESKPPKLRSRSHRDPRLLPLTTSTHLALVAAKRYNPRVHISILFATRATLMSRLAVGFLFLVVAFLALGGLQLLKGTSGNAQPVPPSNSQFAADRAPAAAAPVPFDGPRRPGLSTGNLQYRSSDQRHGRHEAATRAGEETLQGAGRQGRAPAVSAHDKTPKGSRSKWPT